jgi:puromycin-sensitive aminopeptidase
MVAAASAGIVLLPCALIRTVSAAPPVLPARDADPYRLPRTVIPRRYELTIEPDFVAASFVGHEAINVRVREPVDEILLNAVELEIQEAYLTDGSGARQEGVVTLEAEVERARISFERLVSAGDWILHLRFSGSFNDRLRGFYRTGSRGDGGTEQVMGATQFQATDARRAFPCWDEPDFKAAFSVTLIVEPGMCTISNGQVSGETPLAAGKRAVAFAETPPISTYLVAFFVGPLAVTDPVMVNGIPLRIARLASAPTSTDVAVDVGTFALRFFAEYFGIPYPGTKLDIVAVPDLAAGGMENFGAISITESDVLIDATSSSRRDLQSTATVVAHEISHQWFGDLVTMRWWDGLWLNEAFATLMQTLAVDAYRPDWHVWDGFGVSRAEALEADALASSHPIEYAIRAPEEVEGIFDVITYQKGGSVLRMLEQHLGPTTFRQGVSHYLRAHSYGNTETADLWDAIEAATGRPTREMMESWVSQPGFPNVTVDIDRTGRLLTLTQRRFSYLPDSSESTARWQIPITLRVGGQQGAQTRSVLLDQPSATVQLPADTDWVVANAGGHGFYRVRYAPELLHRVTKNLQQTLSVVERFNLVSDTWASVVAGLTPLEDVVELAKLFGEETDGNVWAALVDPFGALIRQLPADRQPVVRAFVRDLMRPALDRLGWAAQPGESEQTGTLRSALTFRLAVLGEDAATQARFRELHATYLADRTAVEPNLVWSSIFVTAYTGGPADFDVLVARYRAAEMPQERERYLFGLPGFQDRAVIPRTLEMTLSDEISPGLAPFVIRDVMLRSSGADLAWDFIKAHWETILARFAEASIPDMLAGITTLSTPALAADVEQFFESNPLVAGGTVLARHLERLRVNVAFRGRASDEISAYFR